MQYSVSYSLLHGSVCLQLRLRGELGKGHRLYRELGNKQVLL